MSKRWADQDSSDEGSVDPEDEEVEKEPQQSQREPTLFAFASGISASTSREEMGAYFESRNCKILSLEARPAEDSRFLVVRIGFGETDSLENCLKASGENFKGHVLKVSLKYEPSVPHHSQHGGRVSGGGGRGGGRNDYRDRDPRERGDRGDRGDRDRRGPGREDSRGGRGGGRISRETHMAAPVDPSPPATRKKIVLAPRTLPVETIGKPVVVKAEIFGGGKPHDEIEYEVRIGCL